MNANVSVWMMILWLVNCYMVISSLFSNPRQFKVESDDKNEASDEVAVVLSIVALVVGIVFNVGCGTQEDHEVEYQR